MRLLIAAASIFLGACSLPDRIVGTQPTSSAPVAKKERRALILNELAIGMTTSQVESSCERRPLRTSDVITRDGKMSTIWAYRGSYLYFAGGKLERIQPVQ